MPTDVPTPGLGTYRLTDRDECADAVRTALEAGYRHVDTAQMYGNEEYVGEGIAAADVPREDVFLATKLEPGNLAYDDAVRTARESRDRLGVDVIDLLYVHWPLRTYDPEETLAALDDLRDDGLIRHVGLSNFTPDLLAAARDRLDAPVAAHQVEMHPLLPQRDLLRDAREHDTALVAYCPVIRGRAGDYDAIRAVADRHDATPEQVCLAWLHENGAVPIPKSSSEAHIRENLDALDLDLSDDDVARIDSIDERERLVEPDDAPWVE
jgi:diketogulonate reductase-like aldo/keto reductase